MNATTEFIQVTRTHELFGQVREQFEAVIKPIYGDQTKALDQIGKGLDRSCEVLVESKGTTQKIIGLVVYKLEPTQEFSRFGAENALELKTLLVVDAATNSRKGVGSKLLSRIEEVSRASKFSSIVVTVSEAKEDARAFFAKKQFSKIGEIPRDVNREFILAKSNK